MFDKDRDDDQRCKLRRRHRDDAFDRKRAATAYESSPLIGLGLFIAQRRDDLWTFSRRAIARRAGASQDEVLRWAVKWMPSDATLIGWNVDQKLVPTLLEAAAHAPPELSCRFLTSLHQVLLKGVVDLALREGGAAAPPLKAVAEEMAIFAPAMDADAMTAERRSGLVDQRRRDLGDEALALWRVFVRSAGLSGLGAEAATDAWVMRLQSLRLVAATTMKPDGPGK